MTNFKSNVLRKFYLLALLSAVAMVQPLTAAVNHTGEPEPVVKGDYADKIKIKIIIIIIKKKPKVAKVTSFEVPGGEAGEDRENSLWAEVEIVGESLNIKMADPDIKGMTIVVPDGIRVPQEIAKQLGRKGAFKISGGKIQMEGNKLGNFEIQD